MGLSTISGLAVTIKFLAEIFQKSATFKIVFSMNMLVGRTQTILQWHFSSNFIKNCDVLFSFPNCQKNLLSAGINVFVLLHLSAEIIHFKVDDSILLADSV